MIHITIICIFNLVTVPGDDTRCNGDRFDKVDDDSKKMISKK